LVNVFDFLQILYVYAKFPAGLCPFPQAGDKFGALELFEGFFLNDGFAHLFALAMFQYFDQTFGELLVFLIKLNELLLVKF